MGEVGELDFWAGWHVCGLAVGARHIRRPVVAGGVGERSLFEGGGAWIGRERTCGRLSVMMSSV